MIVDVSIEKAIESKLVRGGWSKSGGWNASPKSCMPSRPKMNRMSVSSASRFINDDRLPISAARSFCNDFHERSSLKTRKMRNARSTCVLHT